jgi:histidinol-phosphatase
VTDNFEKKELLEFTIELAREAGEITLRYFQKAKGEYKADGSFVTIADRTAESHLRERISKRYPQDGILGEEEGERLGQSGRRWILDPLDGTYTFVHGVPLYGVLIALEIDGEATIGVVNMPAMSEMVWAARGLGCYWNGQMTRVSEVDSLDQALLLCTDFGNCENYGFGSAAAKLQKSVKARRTWGDCYGHLLVATGRAEVMLDPVMNIWDCAPLLPILEEAGGTFTTWSGERTINGGSAISTNSLLYKEVMETIR